MKYSAFILLAFFYTNSFAQIDQNDSIYLNNAERQGNIMAKLLLKKDYKEFSKYTYLPIIEMAGGEEKMVELIEQGMKQIEDQGFSFLNCTIERPLNVIHFKNQLQCTVTQNIELKMPNGRLVTKSTLIGISGDNGENWTFIETQNKDLKTLQTTLPNLSGNLVIPPKQQPIIYKD